MRTGRWFSPLALLLCAGPAAQAQEPIQDDTAELLALLNTPVVSASKSAQSISNAPAKIIAITAEEIRNRGFTDFEEILHDLPGFDFNRGRGVEYSTIFMRGMRTENTDRFLFIWDGIIQNDTWKYNVWLSRQYPLANIERIEVMYGPSSLLYGANAFAGIINVILKKEKDVNGYNVQLSGGSYNTRMAEVNIGKDWGDWRYMFNGRVYRTDEVDINEKSWKDNTGRTRYYNLVYPRDYIPAGTSGSSIVLSSNGIPLRSYSGVLKEFDGRSRDNVNDWFIQMGVGYKGLNLRAFAWYQGETEDTWYVPINRMDGPWTPTGSAVYLTFEHKIWGLDAKAYASVRFSGLDDEKSYDRSNSFISGGANIGTPRDLKVTALRPLDYYALSNREYKVGEQINYSADRVNAVFGAEYISAKNYEDYNTRLNRLQSNPWVRTKQHDERNLAFYGNAQVQASETFSLAAGLRYDYNSVAGEPGGFGHLYTGRLAGIINPNDRHRFKLIYGQAFQAPSPWAKYAIAPGARDLPNPALKPERLTSAELVYEWTPRTSWKNALSVYLNQVTDLIVGVGGIPFGTPPATTAQNNNVGGLRIFGQELESIYYWTKNDSVFFNLTANSTKRVHKDSNDPLKARDGKRLGDLAPLKANAGLNKLFGQHWNLNVRAHYVATRETINYDTPTTYNLKEVDAYLTFDLAMTYRDLFKGLDVRLSVLNLTNKAYYDPGTREADGIKYNSAIIQPGAHGTLGVTYRF